MYRRFGFNAAISQLLTIPPYIVASKWAPTSQSTACNILTRCFVVAVTVVVWAIWSDRIKRRFPFVLCGQLLCLIGFAVNLSRASVGVKYFGTFLIVTGGYAAYPADTAWCVRHTIR